MFTFLVHLDCVFFQNFSDAAIPVIFITGRTGAGLISFVKHLSLVGKLIESTMEQDDMPTDFYKYPCPISISRLCEYNTYKQTAYGTLEMAHYFLDGLLLSIDDYVSGIRGWIVLPVYDPRGCGLPDGLDHTSPYILLVDGAVCSLSDNMQNATAIFYYNKRTFNISSKYQLHGLLGQC